MKQCGALTCGLLFVSTCSGQSIFGNDELEQFTPDVSDWSTFYDKAVLDHPKNTDHSPDGVFWIDRDMWKPWDGTVYNVTHYTKKELCDIMCPQHTVLGMRELFYDTKPFADNVNPTKAEVDNWHAVAINHVRALIGYTGEEYRMRPDKCLHLRAVWSTERMHTRKWDTADYPGTCFETTNGHCGAGFLPSKEDQQPYLPDGIDYCSKKAGSEGLTSAAKSNIPWSVKWIRPFCQTLCGEGFWGGHTGPWFHRTQFGWDWRDMQIENFNSNAGLRAKWGGKGAPRLYEDPKITDKLTTINDVEGVDPNPRFTGIECISPMWSGKGSGANECYERMLNNTDCNKRWMTMNPLNLGCACYPKDMTKCNAKNVGNRRTWDFDPLVSSYDGLFIDLEKQLTQGKLPYSGRICSDDIMWLGSEMKAGDPSHCLQKIIEGDFPDCGRRFITWNSANGGCACYPHSQETCKRSETIGQSGRQTYELEVDPTYVDPGDITDPPVAPTSPTDSPVVAPTLAPILIGEPTSTPPPTSSPPTPSPPTTDQTGSPTTKTCSEDAAAFFLFKAREKGKQKVEIAEVYTCEWLAGQTDKDDMCKKKVSFFVGPAYEGPKYDNNNVLDDDIYGPPQVMCPNVCSSCPGTCYENKNTKFLKSIKSNGKQKLMTCFKLSIRKEKTIKSVCKSTETLNGYRPASLECPETCSIASGQCGLPPVVEPTTAPIITPTRDPASVGCSDDATGYFFQRLVKWGKPKIWFGEVQTCEWLAEAEDKDDRCSNKIHYHDGRAYVEDTDWEEEELPPGVYGPPHTVCKDTCNSCTCYEKLNSKYLRSNNNNKPKIQDCEWLMGRKESDQREACEKTDTWEGYPSASVACPQTCSFVTGVCDIPKTDFPTVSPISHPGIDYLGCFKDEKKDRALTVHMGKNKDIEQCAELCKEYKYFGLQTRRNCRCGNDGYDKHGIGEDCECYDENYIGKSNCVYTFE